MTEPQSTEEPTTDQVKERTARLVRRLGYVVFMGGGLLIFIPMLIGVGSGIGNDRIWDPFTGARVGAEQRTIDCAGEARRLLVDAGRQEALSASWDEPYRAWLTRCKKQEPQLFNLLRETRQELRRGHSTDATE